VAINGNICTRWGANKLIGNYNERTKNYENCVVVGRLMMALGTYPRSSVRLYSVAEC
jgi:hypothetical protein